MKKRGKEKKIEKKREKERKRKKRGMTSERKGLKSFQRNQIKVSVEP